MIPEKYSERFNEKLWTEHWHKRLRELWWLWRNSKQILCRWRVQRKGNVSMTFHLLSAFRSQPDFLRSSAATSWGFCPSWWLQCWGRFPRCTWWWSRSGGVGLRRYSRSRLHLNAAACRGAQWGRKQPLHSLLSQGKPVLNREDKGSVMHPH